MTDEEKVKAKYPDAYAACSWADGKLVAFIYNPATEDGEPTISEDYILLADAWRDAAARIEASHE